MSTTHAAADSAPAPLTRDEERILRINPGTHLISDPITTEAGHRIYFAANENGRIVLQILHDIIKHSPILLTRQQAEHLFPLAMGSFLKDVRNEVIDPRLTRQSAQRRRESEAVAAANPEPLEGPNG